MNQPEIVLALALALAFCCGWIAHAGAIAWWRRRGMRQTERVIFGRMTAEQRAQLLAQLERANALRPRGRRVG